MSQPDLPSELVGTPDSAGSTWPLKSPRRRSIRPARRPAATAYGQPLCRTHSGRLESRRNAGLPHVGNPVYPTASNIRVFAGGVGPLGVEPTCIVKLRAVDTPRCCIMHDRRARSTTKSGFPMAFSAPFLRSGFHRILPLPPFRRFPVAFSAPLRTRRAC